MLILVNTLNVFIWVNMFILVNAPASGCQVESLQFSPLWSNRQTVLNMLANYLE